MFVKPWLHAPISSSRPVERGEVKKSLFFSDYLFCHIAEISPSPTTFGGPPLLKNINYTRMPHFEKQNLKIFSPEGPHENVFPRLHCGSQRPCPRSRCCPSFSDKEIGHVERHRRHVRRRVWFFRPMFWWAYFGWHVQAKKPHLRKLVRVA